MENLQKREQQANKENSKKFFALIVVLYILGIFMGAIDTGIVTPARTVIQGNLGVDDKTGIWMINIFTLAYAAAIPISGKLADRFGRKYIYLFSIFLFGTGSLICGLSQSFASFPMLLVGRVIQAIGGGGIMPIANAEFGTSFPEEKRGMALGIIGGVYGIANILGSSAGSAILNIAGVNNWQWLFYVNLPISVFILIGGIFFLPVNKKEVSKKIDFLGITVLVVMILSLLYGLKAIDFFEFLDSIKSKEVYPYLLVFIILLPFFVLIERKAADPVVNLKYFTNFRITITLLLSVLVGLSMMGMIFVPQFAENALKIPTGTGGYFVTILGLFAGLGAPFSGRLVDKIGPKRVLLLGFAIVMIGGIFTAFVATEKLSLITVIASLFFIGLGMGFAIGTPLNYMMLQNTEESESNSALATLSLLRSIGTTVGPAIMIGFIAHAGASLQDNLMNVLPKPSKVYIKQVDELKPLIEKLKSYDEVKEKLDTVNIPDLDNMGDADFDMTTGELNIPDYILDEFKIADVTNITERTKKFALWIMDDKLPPVKEKVLDGIIKGKVGITTGRDEVAKGISDMKKGIDGLAQAITKMNEAVNGISTGIENMKKALNQQDNALNQMKKAYAMMESMPKMSGNMPDMSKMQKPDSVTGIVYQHKEKYAAGPSIEKVLAYNSDMQNVMDSNFNSNSSGDNSDSNHSSNSSNSNNTNTSEKMNLINGKMPSIPNNMPAGMQMGAQSMNPMNPDVLKQKINELSNAKKQLELKIKESIQKKNELIGGINSNKENRQKLINAVKELDEVKLLLNQTVDKMGELEQAIPDAFEQSKAEYIEKLENSRPVLEKTFQDTLNKGFKDMYITIAIINALGILLLILYREPKKINVK